MSSERAPAARPLSAGQRRALLAICDYMHAYGYPPSARDLLGMLGLAAQSRNYVSELLGALERKGWIARRARSARAICVLVRP